MIGFFMIFSRGQLCDRASSKSVWKLQHHSSQRPSTDIVPDFSSNFNLGLQLQLSRQQFVSVSITSAPASLFLLLFLPEGCPIHLHPGYQQSFRRHNRQAQALRCANLTIVGIHIRKCIPGLIPGFSYLQKKLISLRSFQIPVRYRPSLKVLCIHGLRRLYGLYQAYSFIE